MPTITQIMKQTEKSQKETERRLRVLAAVPIALRIACDKSISFKRSFYCALRLLYRVVPKPASVMRNRRPKVDEAIPDARRRTRLVHHRRPVYCQRSADGAVAGDRRLFRFLYHAGKYPGGDGVRGAAAAGISGCGVFEPARRAQRRRGLYYCRRRYFLPAASHGV